MYSYNGPSSDTLLSSQRAHIPFRSSKRDWYDSSFNAVESKAYSSWICKLLLKMDRNSSWNLSLSQCLWFWHKRLVLNWFVDMHT